MENENVTNTEQAPVVAAEQPAVPAPAETTTPKHTAKKAVVTIARRRVLQGKHHKIGAPKLEILGLHKNRKRGAFTKQDIFDMNGQSVSMLTITKRIKELKKAGELCKMADKAKHTGPGKPADQYNFDLTKAAPKRSRSKKTTGETAPVVANEQPAQAAAEAPAVVEQPAPAVVEAPAAPAEPAAV